MVDTWSTKTVYPISVGSCGAAGVYNGKIYTAGGYTGAANVANTYEYDPILDTFTAKTAMPNARRDGGTAYIGQYMYYVAGMGGSYTNTTYRYDMSADTWSTMAAYPLSLHTPACAADDTYLYMFCGYQSSGNTTLCYKYNTITNSWSRITNYPYALRMAKAIWDGGDYIYVMGGFTTGSIANVYRYSISGNSYTAMSPLPVSRYGGQVSIDIINGKIWYTGRLTGSTVVNTTYEYDIATDTWSTVTPMTVGKCLSHYATVDGKLYVITGQIIGAITNTNYEYHAFGVATGYSNKINGITPSKINGIDVANISKFNGI